MNKQFFANDWKQTRTTMENPDFYNMTKYKAIN